MSAPHPPAGEGRRLAIWNAGVGLLHAVQGTLILVLANDASLPVYASWTAGPPATTAPIQGEPLFDLPIGLAVAVFLDLAGDQLTSWERPHAAALVARNDWQLADGGLVVDTPTPRTRCHGGCPKRRGGAIDDLVARSELQG